MKNAWVTANGRRPPSSYMAAPISPITTDGSVEYTDPNTMLGSSLSLKDGRESTIWRFTMRPDVMTHVIPAAAEARRKTGSPKFNGSWG